MKIDVTDFALFITLYIYTVMLTFHVAHSIGVIVNEPVIVMKLVMLIITVLLVAFLLFCAKTVKESRDLIKQIESKMRY